MAALSGYRISFGLPKGAGGLVAVWGRTPRAWRGQFVAKRRGAGLVTFEDAFLRSVKTGRSGEPPSGLVIDKTGIYFDANAPSDLENILNYARLDDPALTKRAALALGRLHRAELSKYNLFNPETTLDETGYVLVIDQTRGDASIRFGGAETASFTAMLMAARAENPGRLILVKTHPEVTARHRKGHFSNRDLDADMRFLTEPLSPWRLLRNAHKVYCVTSLMGFEAILAGHRPRVFGRPFYGGWGLSDDEQVFERRERTLTVTSLFAGAMLLYPTWYDPFRDRLCDFETAVDNLHAQARAWREDCKGYAAIGMRLWKRHPLRRFFSGAGVRLTFEDDVARAVGSGKTGLVWAGKETSRLKEEFAKAGRPLSRLEDGFLRSRGLGAELVPPMSLVVDDLGIYYDPSRPSRLETLLNAASDLGPAELARARDLVALLIKTRVSKYNSGRTTEKHDHPPGRKRILVPGQVQDDASILLGGGDVRTNPDLLQLTRQENPDAFIVYKPHPDVEAGLRKGAVATAEALKHADEVLLNVDAIAAIDECDEVWTITSLLGFEALLRGKGVVCLGTPFYAGWGLTRDLGPVPKRRGVKLTLPALAHAALIDYPRYLDPQTGVACPPEVVVERLAAGKSFTGTPATRMLAKLQGLFSGFAQVWR